MRTTLFTHTPRFRVDHPGRLDWWCCGKQFRYVKGDMVWINRNTEDPWLWRDKSVKQVRCRVVFLYDDSRAPKQSEDYTYQGYAYTDYTTEEMRLAELKKGWLPWNAEFTAKNIDAARSNAELSPERQAQMRDLLSRHLWTTSFRTVMVSDPFEPERVGELFRPRNELPLDWTPEELAHRGIRQGDAFYLVQLAPMYAAVWTGRYLQTQLYQPVRPDEVDRYMWKLLGIGGAYRVQVR